VPLHLWRNRTYAASITATFLISFGFFGAAIFLPQWFQFVQGATPTNSGLYSLALLAGLIISSIASGQIVARTGRYKMVILVGIAVMAVGLLLMTNLRADTQLPVLWFWMFVTGLGIGPTLSVFTIVVQNAVPFRELGVATSNLTFFRQIGGSIGLALLGTVFGNRFAEELVPQMTSAGVPTQLVAQFSANAGGGAASKLIEVGKDQSTALLAGIPEQFRATVQPFVPNILNGLHQAMSLAIDSIFQIGVVTTAVALAVALVMHEIPLRTTHGPATERASLPMPIAE
jgi:MFS family permease